MQLLQIIFTNFHSLLFWIYLINKNNMKDIKQTNDFNSLNKTREKAGKEIAPVIEKIEAEFALVLSQARQIKDKANEVLKFQSEKLTLEKYIKDVRRDLHQTNNHLASVKAQNELGHSLLGSNINTIKEQVHSLQRTIDRRQQYFQTYDKKLTSIMDTLSKHQAYINDRVYIFQQKFKQLTKQTLEMTKQIKRDFDNTMMTNQILKNELIHKIKNTEDKEKILDLYMNQREEIPKKIHDIYNDLKNCLRHSQFQQFKKWHESAIEESLSKAKKMVDKVLSSNSQDSIKRMELRFAEIEDLKQKADEIKHVKQQVQQLSFKIDSIQKSQDHKIAKIREETEQMEEKIIEVIDKRIQTIQEQIEHINIENEQNLDEKMQKIKKQIMQLIHQKHGMYQMQLQQMRVAKLVVNQQGDEVFISKELATAKRQRQLMQQHSKEIKAIADGLNHKLSLFSNKITMCRSDIEIFVDNTTKQLKKIIDIRKEEESHMQIVGKMFADMMQSVLILTSLSLNEEKKNEIKSYVTYHDGIVLELEKEQSKENLNYRKYQINTFDLKESLILTLINDIDEHITNQQIFRWDRYKPSTFFNKIKENLNGKSKNLPKSPSVHLNSPRRRGKRIEGEQDIMFDLKMESEQLLKNGHQKPTIVVNNSNLLWTCQKPKSQMQKRYKIKRHEQKSKKQGQERNCFTTSRSHRKPKIVFN